MVSSDRVLQMQVYAYVFGLSTQTRIRAENDNVGAETFAHPRERLFRKAIRVGQVQIEFGARDILAGDETKFFACR